MRKLKSLTESLGAGNMTDEKYYKPEGYEEPKQVKSDKPNKVTWEGFVVFHDKEKEK